MKDKNSKYERLEARMTQAHVPEPSALLKQRITAEASSVWNQTSGDVSWLVPLWRLSASAAAVVLIVWLTHTSSDYALAQRSGRLPIPVQHRLGDLHTLSDTPYSPLVKHLVLVERGSSVTDASVWHNYVPAIKKFMEEPEQNRTSNPVSLPQGRSRLMPGQIGVTSHS